MNEIVIFIIGSFIFAITVYGSVMAGGLALTRAEENALPPVADVEPAGSEPAGPGAAAGPAVTDPKMGPTGTGVEPS